MGLDFDVKTFCQNLRATKPPYECPVKECGKIYKSFCGIQFHLYNFDHENPQNCSPSGNGNAKNSNKKKGRWNNRTIKRSPSPAEFLKSPAREGLTYAEAQKLVEVDLDGQIHRINIYEPLDVLMVNGDDPTINIEKPKPEEKISKYDTPRGNSKHRKDKDPAISAAPAPPSTALKLPEANFRVIDDLERPDMPVRSSAYYRFIEKSVEEMDEEVEYDMDEEDCAWLELINEKRQLDDLPVISADSFELLMDRLEKESYFQSQSTGKDPNPSIDEDAVCCICNDGECQNSNVILFCDMCNLAVHQECYGVPYIPEGQWLCRRCLQSPSRAVDCALCPNKGGAFKQTDDNGWAHVVCALWVPEVQFANTVFLEPIDSIKNIPAARWKLSCYICKQRGMGACIQCHKANCYTAFHVTCAQQAGLHMKMEPVRDVTAGAGSGGSSSSFSVRKTAYCDVHTPAENDSVGTEDGDCRMDSVKKAKAKAKSRLKMRKARKILAEKRSAVPVVSVPKIPPERLNHIAQMVNIVKKTQYLQRLLAYWTLKRQSRNGVPLLRRLQSTQQSRRNEFEQNENDKALREQLKYWQRLRQDLERARLLIELIRKREKLKREYIKVKQLEMEMKLQPFIVLLREALDLLQDKDPSNVFAEPVEVDEVPDYADYIKHPMDFSTMRQKVEVHQYSNMDDFEKDFNLIISNCMSYNSKDTMFYRAAIKMRDQGGAVIRQVRRQAEMVGYDKQTGVHLLSRPKINHEHEDDKVIETIDNFMNTEHPTQSLGELLKTALDLLDRASYIKHGGARTKRVKALKSEITVIRRKLALQASGKVMGKKPKKSNLAKVANLNNKTSKPSSGFSNSSDIDTDSESGKEDSSMSSEPTVTAPPQVKTRPKNINLPKTVNQSKSKTLKSPNILNSPKSKAAVGSIRSPKPSSTSTPVRTATRSSSISKSPPLSPKLASSATELTPSNIGRGRRASTVAASKAQRGTIFSNRGRPPKNLKRSRSESDRSSPPPKRVESSYPATPAKLTNSPNSTSTSPSLVGSTNGGSSGSPSGVNRRTAVLFKKKFASQPASSENTPISDSSFKRPANPSKRSISGRTKRPSYEGLASGPYIPGMERPTLKTKKKPSSSSASSTTPPATTSPTKKNQTYPSIGGPVMFDDDFSVPTESDSFKVYRSSGDQHDTDSDSNSETSNTSTDSAGTSDVGPSDITQSTDSDSDDESNYEHRVHSKTRSGNWGTQDSDFIPLEPLDLVWAKCRGYPWYPALIINPKMPKTGYFHNGVPIPVPPDEVLALQKTFNDYLVLFFDAKRTWQWLPRHKLEPLGVDSELDKEKLIESRKPTEKKAVKKAFEKAILHRCRVTGESTVLSEDDGSSNDD